jgi:hypothetical protein
MKLLRKIFKIAALSTVLSCFAGSAHAQMFWLGVNGGIQENWFTSPKVDNIVLGDGIGWNLGFFMKYGQRPFYQVEFRWMRADNTINYEYQPGQVISGDVPFHEFQVPVKVGYTIVRKPAFKWHVNGGMSIGTVFLFSQNNFEFERNDMTNPQVGIIGGTGIQIMNFILDLDYSYHLTDLFKGDEQDLGVDFGAHLQVISLKVGMVF